MWCSSTATIRRSWPCGRGVRAERMSVLHPGTDVPELDPGARRGFRARFQLGERPILLSVGRLTRRKGLAEFVTQALPSIVSAWPTAILVVIGEEATDALHTQSGSERERILAPAGTAEVESNIRFVGRCDQDKPERGLSGRPGACFPVLDKSAMSKDSGWSPWNRPRMACGPWPSRLAGCRTRSASPQSGLLVHAGDYARFAAARWRIARVRADRCRNGRGPRVRAPERTGPPSASGCDRRCGARHATMADRCLRASRTPCSIWLQALEGPEDRASAGSRPGSQPGQSPGNRHGLGRHRELFRHPSFGPLHGRCGGRGRQSPGDRGLHYTQVSDTRLPFRGPQLRCRADQPCHRACRRRIGAAAHLAEFAGYCRPDGVGYLAVPNRWMLVEPHYQLSSSAGCRRMALALSRASGKGGEYDCRPLQPGQLGANADDTAISGSGIFASMPCARPSR